MIDAIRCRVKLNGVQLWLLLLLVHWVRSLDEMRFWIAVFTYLPVGAADLIHLAGH